MHIDPLGLRVIVAVAISWSALGAVACHAKAVNQPTLTNKIDEVSLRGVELSPGVTEHIVTVNGKARRFGVWVPPEGVTARHPLVLFLWGAQRHPRFKKALPCLVEPEIAQLSPIVIAPEASLGKGGEWWRGPEASFALGLLRSAVFDWPVDDRKVVVMGYSNGGIGTWVFAQAYPQYFSAAIPMAFNHSVVGKTPLPVFAIQGSKDELFGSADIVDAVAKLKMQGQDVTLTVRPRGSHFNPCDYQDQLAEARQWLTDKVWSDSR